MNPIIMQSFIDTIVKDAGVGSMFAKGVFKAFKTKAPKKIFTPKARAKVLKGRQAWAGQYSAQTENMARKSTKNNPLISDTVKARRTWLADESARTVRMSNRTNATPKTPTPPKAPETPKTPTSTPPLIKNKKDLTIGAGAGIVGTLGLASLAGGNKQQNRYQQPQY